MTLTLAVLPFALAKKDRVVYRKDPGPNTDAVARAMTRFNPDSGWTVPGS